MANGNAVNHNSMKEAAGLLGILTLSLGMYYIWKKYHDDGDGDDGDGDDGNGTIETVDIGSDVIGRSSTFGEGYTYVNLANPAPELIELQEVGVYLPSDAGHLIIATFFYSSYGYVCRNAVDLLDPSVGESIYSVSIPMEPGDFIGAYFEGGNISVDSIGSGFVRVAGNYTNPGDYFNQFQLFGGDISIGGVGVKG